MCFSMLYPAVETREAKQQKYKENRLTDLVSYSDKSVKEEKRWKKETQKDR